MGRYNFRPQRVYQAAAQLAKLDSKTPPPWYDVIEEVPPSQILVRTQPFQHHRRSKTKKPSKLFQPQNITYPEDKLRREFFGDHPWELARPRVIVENDGKDLQREDWSKIKQPRRPLNGESVIQRQSWLMHNTSISKAAAYDQARREFYEERLQEDVERRIAKEEALATGAYFGKSVLEIGMELEDKMYEKWRKWAAEELAESEHKHASMYTSVDETAAAMSELDPDILAEPDDLDNDAPP